MKIGIFYWSFATYGGGPKVATKTVEALERKGHEVSLFTGELNDRLFSRLSHKGYFKHKIVVKESTDRKNRRRR